MTTNEKKSGAADQSGQRPPGTIRSEQLFGQSSQLQIIHKREIYTLRITANDKLILTK